MRSTMSDYKSKIITFYSYKGGVGRSMALANVAWLLAKNHGHNVLVVDWDLEAPGLHKFFNVKDNDIETGLIDLFYDYKSLLREDEPTISDEFIDLDNYIMESKCDFDNGSLSILPAGKMDENYANRVNNFEWDDFYKNWHGFGFIEYLKDKLKSKADFVIIDSRTGITDIGGICTLQMPDVAVLLFSLNDQCISGTKMIAEKILAKSSNVTEQPNPPKIILIPSRVDKTLEMNIRHEWESKSATCLKEIIELSEDESLDYIKENSIPYIGFYSFGEILAVKKEPKGDLTKSFENLTKIIRMASGCEEGAIELINKGNTLGNLGRYEEALEAYEKATEIKTDDFGAWYNKGNTLVNLGRYEDALEAYEKVTEVKPDFFNAWINKGNTLDTLGRYEDALEAYEKVTEVKPDDVNAWINKGSTLRNLERYEEALETYEKAIEIKPDNLRALNNKGSTLRSLGRREDALEVLEKAIEIKPDDVDALNGKGATLDNLGRGEDALEAFEKAIEIKPDDVNTLKNKGITLKNLGRHEDALEVFEKAIEIKPDEANAWYYRALCFSLTNKKEDSLYNLKQAIEFDSSYKKQAKKDSDFEKLWDDPYFIKIVEL